jgi:type 1 glutamine amidotransferase
MIIFRFWNTQTVKLLYFMKTLMLRSLLLLLVGFTFFSFDVQKDQRVLVFSKTGGFRHKSIPVGKKALMDLGTNNNFAVDTTEDASVFTPANLKKYDAVVFLSTTGNDILNAEQKQAFQQYIRSGGGFVGIHAASDTEYNWEWYGKMVGGYFLSHPKNQTAKIQVLDRQHISTRHLPAVWERYDEWYNYKSLNPDVKVLMNLDEKSYQGGKNGDNHPIAWYHAYDGGRAWYTGLGHTDESFSEPEFMQHVLGGIQYAMGAKPNGASQKPRAKSQIRQ